LFGSTANKPMTTFGFPSTGSTFGANQQSIVNEHVKELCIDCIFS
jgi:hypothetical protein